MQLFQVEHAGPTGADLRVDAPRGDRADYRDLHAEPVAAEASPGSPLEPPPQREWLHDSLSVGRRSEIRGVHSRPPPTGRSQAHTGVESG